MIDVKSMSREQFKEYLCKTVRSSMSETNFCAMMYTVETDEYVIGTGGIDAYEELKDYFHAYEFEKEIARTRLEKIRLSYKLRLSKI
jgi:hypothetical protein